MKTMFPHEIKVGDFVKMSQSDRSSGFSGIVYKVSQVNLSVMSKYQMGSATEDNPPVDLDLGKQRRGSIDYVKRNEELYKVIK